jgi:glycosyltransferase involved in cell wall biosynthesis
MRIWIVMTGEALPSDGKNVRLRRAATLARECAVRGHDVTWWTSTFNHQGKIQRAGADKGVTTEEGVRVEMLYSPAYRRNVSIGRLINHRLLGKSLARRIQKETPPDVIFCAWPTIEFSVVSTAFGHRNGVPVIIDVRDLWPDIFLDVVPRQLRPVMRVALQPMVRAAKDVFRKCAGITAISPGYLDWALGYAKRPRNKFDQVFPLGYEKPTPSDIDAAQARRELAGAGVDPAKKICWFVGVFGATYDLTTVIKTAALLQERGRDDIQFVLSGGGEKNSEWRKMAEGLRNVVFTGWVDGAKIVCLGEMSSIGLAAYTLSAPQGLPNKLYEYMAFGLPVVSSLRGEAEQFLAENRCGLTYQSNSPESLISELLRLVDNQQLQSEYGANGRELYNTQFRSEKVYPAMVDYLETVGSTIQRDHFDRLHNVTAAGKDAV